MPEQLPAWYDRWRLDPYGDDEELELCEEECLQGTLPSKSQIGKEKPIREKEDYGCDD